MRKPARETTARPNLKGVGRPDPDDELLRRPKVDKENLNRDLQPGDIEDNDSDTQQQG